MPRLLVWLLPFTLCAAEVHPLPRFTDPGRKAKLAKAYPELDILFERFMKERGAPGLVYGVVIDGELAHVKSFGVREREGRAPVTPDSVFRIASMTKSFTALAILKLRDEGKLSLEDPVSKYVPEFAKFRYPTGDTAPIRVRQLLTHGAGFPEDNPWGDQQLGESDARLTEWLRQGIPFSTAPDTEYEYSNYGFALLGRIVTKASGVPYREYLEKRILAPLGMTASTLEPSAVPAAVRATGYRKTGDAYSVEPSLAHGSFGAMGGLLTSARDLAKYVAFHLDAYPPRDGAEAGPVTRASLREMHRPWRASSFRASHTAGALQASAGAYGYGLGVTRDCRFGQIVGHGGGLPGFGSYMVWLPEYGVGLFAMANVTYAGPGTIMTGAALDALRKTGGLRPRELPPSQAVLDARDAILKLWENWTPAAANAAAADNLFKDRSAEDRRAQIEKIKSEVGACRPVGDPEPENWLRARFRLECDRGYVGVVFTLAPTSPPKLQFLYFESSPKMTAETRGAIEGLLASFGGEEAGRQYGACRIAQVLGADTVRLECERGAIAMRVKLDAQGKASPTFFWAPCLQ